MASRNEMFLQKLNKAYVKRDTDTIAASVTEDIVWTKVGNPPIHGKRQFMNAMAMMEGDGTQEVMIDRIITHGIHAAVEGTKRVVEASGAVKTYAFCDIYLFNKFKDGKVKEMTSYVIQIKN